jgi:hypothetical protein
MVYLTAFNSSSSRSFIQDLIKVRGQKLDQDRPQDEIEQNKTNLNIHTIFVLIKIQSFGMIGFPALLGSKPSVSGFSVCNVQIALLPIRKNILESR